MDIIDQIKNDIKDKLYQDHYPNDGQRFVAWYLRNVYLLDANQAREAVTDGANDKQIDAVYVDNENQKVIVIQGKYYTGDSINAEPVREVVSSWVQLGNLQQMQESANGKLKTKLAELASAVKDDDYSICFELVTSSYFSEDAKKDIEAFQTKLTDSDDAEFDSEFFAIDRDDLQNRYNQAILKDNPSINHVVNLSSGKYLYTELSQTKVCIAALDLKECIKFPGIKDGTLFQKNVRQNLGISNSVNKKIRKTLIGDKAGDFFFFHNGITAICNKMEKDGDCIKLHGLSVVNGCQSLNSILSCSESVKKHNESYVLMRFYEIPQKDRADSISINTNTQSAVKARDLRSNDKKIIKLKKAYEERYREGFFAAKRGDVIPADKKKEDSIELSELGKYLIAWYSQRPNLSYGETKIFDKYFDTLFKKEYKPEDLYALNFWFNRIMQNWTLENPLGIDETLLTMKAYVPYHFLYAISMVFAKLNNSPLIPSPSECLDAAEKSCLTNQIVGMVANCINQAYQSGQSDAEMNGRAFIPQNWVKNKACVSAIQMSVGNIINFMPTMNMDLSKKLKENLKLDPSKFEYRLSAD